MCTLSNYSLQVIGNPCRHQKGKTTVLLETRLDCCLTDLLTFRSAPKSAQSLNQFHWSGATLQHDALEPNGTAKVIAHACFQKAGIYDVNRWRLTIQNAHEDGTPDLDSVPHIQLPTLPQIMSIQ